MSSEKVEKIVKQIQDIPTLPIISQQIQDLFTKNDVSIKQIGGIIAKDPPLAAKVLQIVNSSFYSLLNKVTSIEHAMVILGFNEVKSVVLGFSIRKFFKDRQDTQFDRNRFWKHSIVCSNVAKMLGKQFNIVDDGSFFLSGLIHDIGKLVIDQYFHEEFKQIIDHINENGSSFSTAEKEILGVTHYQVAAKLLQQWNFPKKVIMQTFYHHAPWSDKNYTTGSVLVYLANILTKLCGYTCLEHEQVITIEDIVNSSVIGFLNKNRFELDAESFEMLKINTQEFLSSEIDNILDVFK